MKINFNIVIIVGLICGCKSNESAMTATEQYNVPLSDKQSKGWFFDIAVMGSSGSELSEFITVRFKREPELVGGIYIRSIPDDRKYIYWSEEQKRTLLEIIQENESYWLVDRQGPWTNQHMYLVFSGKTFLKSKLIYREIVDRACY